MVFNVIIAEKFPSLNNENDPIMGEWVHSVLLGQYPDTGKYGVLCLLLCISVKIEHLVKEKGKRAPN